MLREYELLTDRQASIPPVIAGSHLDTQPTGGRFDRVP